MDFLEILSEVTPWKGTNKTYKVKVTDPEEYYGYMVEYIPINPRHMLDIIMKIQPLLSKTIDKVFASVILAFRYDDKYYVIYEYFDEIDYHFSLETSREILASAEAALKRIHK